MDIYYSSNFAKQFKKLSPGLQKKAIEKEAWFRQNPFNPSLRTHKLIGSMKGIWSFSLDYKHRILFRFIEHNRVLFESVGDHSVYRQR